MVGGVGGDWGPVWDDCSLWEQSIPMQLYCITIIINRVMHINKNANSNPNPSS